MENSSITFSISGILSTNRSKKEKENENTRDKSSAYTTSEDPCCNFTTSSGPYYSRVIRRNEESCEGPLPLPVIRHAASLRNYSYHDQPPYLNREFGTMHAEPNWTNSYQRLTDPISPIKKESCVTWSRKSPDETVKKQQTAEKRSSPTGRFRPPPFFETVLALRKRLYYLGGKDFSTEEPPTDRNVHKLWRAMEKHKVNYSLQHYFYVASLSNRCFDLVERIHKKVTLGLLEGSREKEVNQSYFNFLYGRTEEERYRLLCLLEKGQISPKEFVKQKQNNCTKTQQVSSTTCHSCEVTVTKLTTEKAELEEKYLTLKRKYDELLQSNSDEKLERKRKRSSNDFDVAT